MSKLIRSMTYMILILILMAAAYTARPVVAFAEETGGVVTVAVDPLADTSVRISLDGAVLATDTPAVIVQERTLVPARAVFEAMGGTAEWNNDTREVTIRVNGTVVLLTIDSATAYVNGEARVLDVPAAIISDRTMVPVRFIAESVGSTVGWDNDQRIVLITSPIINENNTNITGIVLTDDDDSYIVEINADKPISDYDDFTLENPDRFVLDLKDAVLRDLNSPIAVSNNETIKTIRYSQFDEESVRVVVDLKADQNGRISRSADKRTIFVKFKKEDADSQPDDSDGPDQDDNDDEVLLPELDSNAEDLLIIIDPGHGGVDTGAIGFENGEAVLYEKDVNLDVALRLNELLEDAGVNTYMLREGDTSISLQERPAEANALHADLYVSIHNNSSDNQQARGVEVLYYTKAGEENYNIYSKRLAEIAQAEMLAELGIPDRTIKERPLLAVLNKTEMPAIIIEGAFISNPLDIELMKSDEFREHYAIAAARAIIMALNESVE